MAANKIPPHLARELRRHLPKKTSAVASGTNAGSKGGEDGFRKMKTFIGCCVFTAGTASIPFWAMKWIAPLNERDEALTHAQIRRGAFNNSGSRDVGKDPMWDFRTGTRIKDKGYEELFHKDDPDQIEHGDQFKRRR
uniref:Uncharacterized protein n=1 Tax=Ditylum brightwellii TaxID=49249 RepID=A0A6S9ILF6_9STRA|mmetsp:Transcript_34516/g.46255  ORF Transcript_34516/g.46255 Transcript_34516/m.46255 type:complete len:137 (+) Transcript_34516:156-566(+)